MTTDNWLEIGTIVAPQGLDGELRVYPNSDFPERFLEPGPRWIRSNSSEEPREIELLGGRYIPGKGIYAIEIAGVEDREAAEALRGSVLLVPESDRPVLEEGEYHVLDLIGLQVHKQPTGELLGKVVDVIPAGNDLLVVELLTPEPTTTEIPEQEIAASETPIHPSTRRGGKKQHKKQAKVSKPPQILIPFVNEIVPVVDLESGRLEINPPAGLLEV